MCSVIEMSNAFEDVKRSRNRLMTKAAAGAATLEDAECRASDQVGCYLSLPAWRQMQPNWSMLLTFGRADGQNIKSMISLQS